MPDENKFAKLLEIGYVIAPCCHLCNHAEFDNPVSVWGKCDRATHRYDHKKHSDTMKKLGVMRFGCCRDGFSLDVSQIRRSSYSRFYTHDHIPVDMMQTMQAFRISVKHHPDEDCPENECWVSESPYLEGVDVNTAHMSLFNSVQAAIDAIQERFKDAEADPT